MKESASWEVTRKAQESDNVVIVTGELAAGTRFVSDRGDETELKWRVLEGHRIACRTVEAGEELVSWGLPFGRALRRIEIGEALFNEGVLRDLEKRGEFEGFPEEANFEDWREEYGLGDGGMEVTEQVARYENPGTFLGFRRGNGRGVGTRNYVILLGVSSRVSGFIRLVMQSIPVSWKRSDENFNGVVPVTHTEGGGAERDRNYELVLRTLAGWVAHPNIGGVLLIDQGSEPVNKRVLEEYMVKHGYPLEGVEIRQMSLAGKAVAENVATARGYLDDLVFRAEEAKRVECPLSELKIALQCGGSDAFSGMSGNPLAGWMAREVLKHGGSANLAETSELIGAERYVLSRVRNRDVAVRFLETIERFQRMAGWHGHSAEGNPSGGNMYRGLYNITIKSIGAANKKLPDVRLDDVIEYGEPMTDPGFYFMDSAGNDLESIAGQVASGCNLILFITGNGSITNFPFVPTIKIVTTTGRYRHLEKDMDVNAGEYLDGTAMDELGNRGFRQMLRVSEGEMTAGEKAGHSQVQIWRTWHLNGDDELDRHIKKPAPDGKPMKFQSRRRVGKVQLFKELKIKGRMVNLLIPTSLCSSQISNQLAGELSLRHPDQAFKALAHTEGCGVSRGPSEELFVRTMCSYAVHPMVRSVVFLEHGCEKTHQAEFQQYLRGQKIQPERFAWMSIQGAGGLEKVRSQILDWPTSDRPLPMKSQSNSLEVSDTEIISIYTEIDYGRDAVQTEAMASMIEEILDHRGGSIVIGEHDPMLQYLQIEADEIKPTLAYGELVREKGFHIMEMPTKDPAEILTGLEASGAWMSYVDAPESGSGRPGLSTRISFNDDYTALIPTMSIEPLGFAFQITRGYQGFSL